MSSAVMVNSMLRSYLGYVPAAEHPASAGYSFNKLIASCPSPMEEAPRLYKICGISWPPVRPFIKDVHCHESFRHGGLRRGSEPGRNLRPHGDFFAPEYFRSWHNVDPKIIAPRPIRPISRRSLECEAQDLLATIVPFDLKQAIDAAGSLSPPPSQASFADENVSPLSASSSLPEEEFRPIFVPEHQLRKDRKPLGVLHYDIENSPEAKPFKPPTARVFKPKSTARGWDRLRPLAPKRLDIEATSTASSSDVELTSNDDTSDEPSLVSLCSTASRISSPIPMADFDTELVLVASIATAYNSD